LVGGQEGYPARVLQAGKTGMRAFKRKLLHSFFSFKGIANLMKRSE